MFEKHKTSKPESGNARAQNNPVQAPKTSSASGRAAVIGPGIQINGDIRGKENLVIEGRVEGTIQLASNQVDIGPGGQVKANVSAKVIRISGKVRGDLDGSEKVIISNTGNVHGNIKAPRLTLEDGAIFKGSIDMDPGEAPVKTQAAKPVAKSAETPKTVSGEKPKSTSGYSLHGK